MKLEIKRIPTSLVLKLGAMILFMMFVLWKIDYSIFWKTIISSNLLFILFPILLFFPTQLLAAYRWHFLLKVLGCPLPYRMVVRNNILGQFSALFLPGQISGDIVRTFAISKGKDTKITFAVSVVIDKLSVLVAISVFAIVGILTSKTLSGYIAVASVSFIFCVAILIILFVFCRYRDERAFSYIYRAIGLLPMFFRDKFSSIYIDASVARVPFLSIFFVLILGLGLQLVNTIGMSMIAYAMHIMITPIDWLAISAVVSIVQILPITFGGLGVREGTFAGILSLYAVPVAQSTACSLTGFVLVAILLFCSWIILESKYASKLWLACL